MPGPVALTGMRAAAGASLVAGTARTGATHRRVAATRSHATVA